MLRIDNNLPETRSVRATIVWSVLVVFVALIEATWLRVLRLEGVLPDLILILVVYYAIVDSEERAMYTGALGGIFQDVAADTGLGHHVLCLVVVGFAVGRLSKRLITDSPGVKAGLVFCASVVHGLMYIGIDYIQNPAMNVLNTIGVSLIPRSFYTALVTPIVYFLLDRTYVLRQSLQRGAH